MMTQPIFEVANRSNLDAAEPAAGARKRLVELLEKHVTRDADLRRIKPLILDSS